MVLVARWVNKPLVSATPPPPMPATAAALKRLFAARPCWLSPVGSQLARENFFYSNLSCSFLAARTVSHYSYDKNRSLHPGCDLAPACFFCLTWHHPSPCFFLTPSGSIGHFSIPLLARHCSSSELLQMLLPLAGSFCNHPIVPFTYTLTLHCLLKLQSLLQWSQSPSWIRFPRLHSADTSGVHCASQMPEPVCCLSCYPTPLHRWWMFWQLSPRKCQRTASPLSTLYGVLIANWSVVSLSPESQIRVCLLGPKPILNQLYTIGGYQFIIVNFSICPPSYLVPSHLWKYPLEY